MKLMRPGLSLAVGALVVAVAVSVSAVAATGSTGAARLAVPVSGLQGADRLSLTSTATTSTTTSTTAASTTTTTIDPTTTSTTTTTTVRPATTTTTTTSTTTTTTTSTTTTTTTTVPDPTGGRFETLPVGAALPSGAQCASRVRSAPEIRNANRVANQTRGTSANSTYPRADGSFTGTTDEILQWVACKWGIDEDVVRAQAAKESWWNQAAGGDLTNNQASCHPSVRTASGPCPESLGLLQVRFDYHGTAFVDSNAINSAAYNADYAYAWWRECFEGRFAWLNDVERGATYGAGDAEGCLGVWFSGRWYTQPALDYIAAVEDYRAQRVWESQSFANG